MRSTTSFTTAMHRLANKLSWHIESNGRTWFVKEGFSHQDFEGLTFKSISLLCLMTRVATSPKRFGGPGWPRWRVREVIGLHIPRDRDGLLVLPSDTSGTDEATLYQLFKGVD